MEGSLAESQAENDKLNNETNLKTEIEKNSNLQKSLKELQEKCLDFGSRCV
jgi:hypothetical protein